MHFTVNTFFFVFYVFYFLNLPIISLFSLSSCFSSLFYIQPNQIILHIFAHHNDYVFFNFLKKKNILRQPAQGLFILSISISHHTAHVWNSFNMADFLFCRQINKMDLKGKKERNKITRKKDNTFILNGTISHFFWEINWKYRDFLCISRIHTLKEAHGNLHL